ncbi:putative Fe2+/Mn2+ transporter, VIT1/CCC1 family [Erythrobacter litoralis]|uniref:Membrane protein n=1 Tax=Erythrobacter litoralis TaxID=39960 RepID=A0A074N188_9SPHN|nr:VIT family protein [Erythrobacter litoralis]AOL23822.1 putative Fe2+/Mn2+ transporter, VIT1/CCC1 family [Erythrobacter litoralis]KEO98695.1 membrane protein [Erythrobacter litoralis]
MTDTSSHPDDPHFVNRTGWLRAAVLGANDGIVSVASLIVGVASASPSRDAVLVAGVAGLVAGALSMAAGEYISVSSQADLEQADIRREKVALKRMPEEEFAELRAIYEGRGLTNETADLVARELTEHDALDAHLRDELGLSDAMSANPLQAALASGLTFSSAAAIPLLAGWLSPVGVIIPVVLGVSVFALALLGALGARAGGAPVLPAVVRVVVWGVIAMAVTAAIGSLFGVSV